MKEALTKSFFSVFGACRRVAPERPQVCPSPHMGYLVSE